MTAPSAAIVQKLWSYCNVLLDAGLTYLDYTEQLTYLLFLKVAVGSAAARGDQTELAVRFRLPATNATNSVFLTAAKSLLAAAQERRELLVNEGMEPALLEDLSRMVSEFETASEAQRTARRDHIGARVDLEGITSELMKQVNVLDGITRYRFGNDAEVMAEWNAAKQVLGLPRPGATPPAAKPGDEKAA